MRSCTPLRPRSTRWRRNADRPDLSSLAPSQMPTISRKPSELTALATSSETLRTSPAQVRFITMPSWQQRFEQRPFFTAEIKSHDPPPHAMNHARLNYSMNYLGTDPRRSEVGHFADISSRSILNSDMLYYPL